MISIAHERFERFVPAVFIKEARQGLSQHAFVIQFAIFHAFLAFTAFSSITAASAGMATGSPFERIGMYWTIVSLYLLLVAPFAGVGSLSGEINGGTIELMRMTNLSARRIVYGKWFYQLVYIFLMALSATPYLLVLDLATSGDPFSDLAALATLAFASCLITGGAIGFSSIATGRWRVPLYLGLFLALFIGFSATMGSLFRTGGHFLSWDFRLLLFGLGLPAAFYMLELGASRIGAEAESGAVALRALGLISLLGSWAMIGKDGIGQVAFVLGGVVYLLLTWQPMLSAPICHAGIVRRYYRLGGFGLWLGRWFLYPGWHTGAAYVALLSLVYAGLLGSFEPIAGEAAKIYFVFSNLAMLPVFFRVTSNVFRKPGQGFPTRAFAIALGTCLTTALAVGLVFLYTGGNLMYFTSATPIHSLIYILFSSMGESEFMLQFGFSVFANIGMLVALFIQGSPVRTRMREVEKQAVFSAARSELSAQISPHD